MKRRFKKNIICFVLIMAIIIASAAVVKRATVGEVENYSKYIQVAAEDKNISAKKMIKNYADENGYTFSDYPQSLVDLLKRNKETKEFVLNYPKYKDKHFKINMKEYKNCDSVPLFMQWDIRWGYKMYGDDVAGLTACGPTCLSMVAVYLLQDIKYSPDYMIDWAKENGYCVDGSGSLWTLMSEGAQKLGIDSTELPLDKQRVINNLEVGNPVVCIMGPGDFTKKGHFIVMTGIENGKFSGAIDLKDLIIARQSDTLDSIIIYSYPYFYADEKISDSIEKIKDYAEDSLPVLNRDKEIVGIITAQDVVEAVDDEMGEDYAKLAGLTAEEDLQETTKQSIKKRLPWLIVLLVLGMGVSAVVGAFENVVAILPIVICFQSLILDMAGNVGTQSLAVTIRVLMDEELAPKDKLKLVLKEAKVGFSNGFLLGILAIVFLGLYIFLYKGYDIRHAFLISLCVGVSLLLAMIVSSLVGTLVPLFFKKIKVDPAVASGPLITTVNDLVAVVIYYGLSWVFLIQTMHILG